MKLWSLVGVEWSDWVIRLPGGGGAWETALGFLILALVVYALIRGTVAIGDKITGAFWSLVTLAFFIVVVLAIARLQDDEPAGPIVDHEIGKNECPEQLLSECPPLTQDPYDDPHD
ncbi:MAG: hypothetical protein OEV40_10920 [Acidimicrobiia bacterium]|nr:hypothetical protein [Acidimicrobiia bacterium]